MKKKIVLLGAGNVATHLAKILIKEGFNLCQIYSKTMESARELGTRTGISYTKNIGEVFGNADIYIFALSDSVIETVLKSLKVEGNPLILHTAGSVSKDILKPYSKNYGIIYPLQTFSKSREVNFKEIPLCIDASNDSSLEQIKIISNKLSNFCHIMDDEKRKYLHLGAVFACNFTNYMYSLAENVLDTQNIDFNILKPLIKETAAKIDSLSPRKAQTGPAIRNDKNTLNKHKELLDTNHDLKKLYTFISNNILKFKDKDGIF